jgi:hypothetical protein
VDYLGVDFNGTFISSLRRRHVPCVKMSVLDGDPIETEYSLMMGSLYQFIPGHKTLVDRILQRTARFIIAEPVKNYAGSRHWMIRQLAHVLNDPGDGVKRCRFSPASFREFLMKNYEDRLAAYIEGDIEHIAVLKGDRDFVGKPAESKRVGRPEDRARQRQPMPAGTHGQTER